MIQNKMQNMIYQQLCMHFAADYYTFFAQSFLLVDSFYLIYFLQGTT